MKTTQIKTAFDNNKYLLAQKKAILGRVAKGEGRLYLEFGGKLIGDFHAARVLPGYDPDVKIELLKQLSKKADIIICIHSEDIAKRKMRADYGISYEQAALKLIDDLRGHGIEATAVVITRYKGQASVLDFKKRIEKHGMKVFFHESIDGYPTDIKKIASPKGFGRLPYIPVTQQLVVVTGPGPNSGKMGTCLSQIYHETIDGKQARYAKFETFPVWDMPLNHPVNVAYEAATADLRDYNAIDNFHLEAYHKKVVNYNRDLQAFPLLKALLNKITGGKVVYQSPTDMGMNCVARGIVDDDATKVASNEEIMRRYFQYNAAWRMGSDDDDTAVERMGEILLKVELDPNDRPVVKAARAAAQECENQKRGDGGIFCGAAIRLHDEKVITGKNSAIMHSASSMILNALKYLAEIPDSQHLLQPDIMESVASYKDGLGTSSRKSLNLNETLIILVVSASRDIYAKRALDSLYLLKQCDVHLSHVPGRGDEAGMRHLGCSYTYDPVSPTKKLFA